MFRVKVVKLNGNSFYIKDCMRGGPKVYGDYNKASDEVDYQRKLREDNTKFIIEEAAKC